MIWGILCVGLVCVLLDVSYFVQCLVLILEIVQLFWVVVYFEYVYVVVVEWVLLVEELVVDIEFEIFVVLQFDELVMLLFIFGFIGWLKGVEFSYWMWVNYIQW